MRFAKALVPNRMSPYSRGMHERRMKWFPAAAALALEFMASALAYSARALAVLILAGGVHAQQPAGGNGYADEDLDWGIAPTNRLRQPPYHGPTPRVIPGAQVVQTRELQAMLARPGSPILIDVLSEEGHVTLAGALWLPGAGRGANFLDPAQSLLTQLLAQLAGGDKARAIVFFCANSQCWLSYNAALRAVAAGYGKVYWYRGGIEAWMAAGLPVARTAGRR